MGIGWSQFWVEPSESDPPSRWHAYPWVPLLDHDRYEPYYTRDDQGFRVYLPAEMGPGLVVAIIKELVWLAPMLTVADFASHARAQEVFQLCQTGALKGWVYLPPHPESQGGGFVVPLYHLTVYVTPALKKLLCPPQPDPSLKAWGALSDMGQQHVKGSLAGILAGVSV